MRCLTKNRTHGSGRGALRDQVKNKKMGYSDQRLLEYVTSTINRYSNIEEEKKGRTEVLSGANGSGWTDDATRVNER
jgi:hypothetical protein